MKTVKKTVKLCLSEERLQRLEDALWRIENMCSLNSEEYREGYAEIGSIALEAINGSD